MNLGRIAAVAWKEWRETIRDRMFVLLAFLLPVSWMFVFGYGLVQDVEHIPFGVIDRDHSALSRDYLYRFFESRYFSFQGYIQSEKEADGLLQSGKIRVAIVVPEQFEERLLRGQSLGIQTLIDGTFPLRTDIVKGYVIAINSAFTGERLVNYLARRSGSSVEQAESQVHPIRVEVRYLYNEEVRSTWSMVPALVMFTLMVSSPLLTALGIVREKETGSIYNIYSSTVTRFEYLAGKLLPYVVISSMNAVILWQIATQWFQVPFKGNPTFFFRRLSGIRVDQYRDWSHCLTPRTHTNRGARHYHGREYAPNDPIFWADRSRLLSQSRVSDSGSPLSRNVLYKHRQGCVSERGRSRSVVVRRHGPGSVRLAVARSGILVVYQEAAIMKPVWTPRIQRIILWLRRLAVMTRKEMLQLSRDVPIGLLLVYSFTLAVYIAGNGIRSQLHNASILVLDADHSFSSRELIHTFQAPFFSPGRGDRRSSRRAPSAGPGQGDGGPGDPTTFPRTTHDRRAHRRTIPGRHDECAPRPLCRQLCSAYHRAVRARDCAGQSWRHRNIVTETSGDRERPSGLVQSRPK